MAKKRAASKRPQVEAPSAKGHASWANSPHLVAAALLVLAVLVFHWEPLFSSRASIQWDAVDVHYSAQKYFADHLWGGRLPYWTPYLFSGYPFLADPQTGAWYPLNWPFFLLGVTPGALQAELAIHSFLGAMGAYLFAWRKLGRREPALVAALAYAFSGFFAGHASHIGIFQSASWLGWILLAVDRGVEESGIAWKLLSGSFTGVMILAGHFQTALYIGFAVASYTVWLVVQDRERWKQAVAAVSATALIGVAISAVMVAPGLELLAHSVRAGADFGGATNSALVPGALGTLIYPNLYGVFSETYKGPADITQYYFYAGILLLPLAVLGMRDRTVRWAALVLVLPALWYAFGPAGGFYSVLTRLPGLGAVRAPVHMWFVVAFGLALLAGAGLRQAMTTWKISWLPWVVPAVLFCDLFWFNSATNRVAYARASFAELYGNALGEFQQRIGAQLPELMRFHAPHPIAAFGPQNHPLDAQVESTYGYNPLRLTNYSEYLAAAEENPKLLAELGAKFRLNPSAGGVEATDDVLPRVTIPENLIQASSAAEAGVKLRSLDPRQAAVVMGTPPATQDKDGNVSVAEHREGFYRIRYRLKTPTLVRVAEVYYPGWEAQSNGERLEVMEVDRALIGVVVPAGEGEVSLRFRTRRLAGAAGISLVAAMVVALGLMIRSLRSKAHSTTGARAPAA